MVCSGIERAIQYFHAFKAYLAERKSPCKAIVAFSGEPEYQGQKVSEGSLNPTITSGNPISGSVSRRKTNTDRD